MNDKTYKLAAGYRAETHISRTEQSNGQNLYALQVTVFSPDGDEIHHQHYNGWQVGSNYANAKAFRADQIRLARILAAKHAARAA